jgi:hypothetical protein
MGHLTESMTSLRQHIDSSRESRLTDQNIRVAHVNTLLADFATTRATEAARDVRVRMAFVTDNANNVHHSLNNFRHTRYAMNRQASESRKELITALSKETMNILSTFKGDRQSMAEREARNRNDFITTLTNTTAKLISDAAQDRAGARAAFFGKVTSKKKKLHG